MGSDIEVLEKYFSKKNISKISRKYPITYNIKELINIFKNSILTLKKLYICYSGDLNDIYYLEKRSIFELNEMHNIIHLTVFNNSKNSFSQCIKDDNNVNKIFKNILPHFKIINRLRNISIHDTNINFTNFICKKEIISNIIKVYSELLEYFNNNKDIINEKIDKYNNSISLKSTNVTLDNKNDIHFRIINELNLRKGYSYEEEILINSKYIELIDDKNDINTTRSKSTSINNINFK